MFAVVETSGKQYQIQEGKYIDIDLLEATPDTNITLDKVVAIIAGEESKIGQPYIEGATVKAKVLKHGKNKKVVSFKMRRKKGYRLKKGHRQDFTRILIEDIEFPEKDKTLSYVKTLQEETEKKLQEESNKIAEAKAKKEAKEAEKAQARKQAQSKKTKPETKEKTSKAKQDSIEEKPVEVIEEVVEETEVTNNVSEEITTSEENDNKE